MARWSHGSSRSSYRRGIGAVPFDRPTRRLVQESEPRGCVYCMRVSRARPPNGRKLQDLTINSGCV